jgi:diguanylate cyclase (GGDEF)-like protein
MKFNGKPLGSAATLVLVSALIVVSVYMLGQFTLARMLAHDAIMAAELWSRFALETDEAEAAGALRKARQERIGQSFSAQIDQAFVIAADGGIELVLGGEAGAQDFARVMAGAAGPGVRPYQVESGAYTTDRISFLTQPPYRSWVVFPNRGAGQPRLAVRVEQTETAAAVVSAFLREVVFSGGVAVITFGSFMAGFSYRQRQLRAENDAIRYQALHDELTGLANRKKFETYLTESLSAGEQAGNKSALFMLDLDGFKAVNDSLGHPVGDGLLKAVATRLKGSLRGGDLLARLSGDEFAIVVPKVTDPSILSPLADRVLQMLSAPFNVDGHEIQVSGSIGVAVAPDNGSDLSALLRNADFALYRAKSEGRRTWRFFDPKMAADQASRRTLEDGLRHALENDQFELLYQPQIELSTGRTLGYEAVLRWRLPGKGLLPASVFMNVAEESGLVVPIGEWVIRQVARDCGLIPAERRVAINLSAAQLKRDSLEMFLADTLAQAGVDPERIEVEVNESILGRHEDMAFTRLKRIRETGISIVMDCFGVGTLSLGLLSRYSFDKIKVDRSFLLNDEQKSGAVLAAVCSLGRSLGFRVAGQGVETADHAVLLRAAGCSEAQGYYFAAPMPLDELLKMEEAESTPPLAAIA